MSKTYSIESEFMTLGQFLKMTGTISTGGMAKWFLSEHEVYINGEQEWRRGKKLYPGDKISIVDYGDYLLTR